MSEVPEDGPWGFKRFPGRVRWEAVRAAERAQQSITDWAAEAFTEKVARERARQMPRLGDILSPGQTEGQTHSSLQLIDPLPPLDIAELERAVALAARIARLHAERKISARLAAKVRRHLLAHIGEPPVRPGVRPKIKKI